MGFYKNTNGVLTPIAGGVSNSNAPIGAIYPYGGTSAPSGYLMCDGSAVSRTDYAALFAVIGTSFGAGDGSTTFNVPDLREATTKGVGLSGKSSNHYDSDGVALGEFVEDRIKSHTHSMNHTHTFSGTTGGMNSNASHTHTTNGFESISVAKSGFGYAGYINGTGTQTTNATNTDHTHNYSGTTSGASTSTTGSTGSATTEVKAVGVNYIIKAKDVNLSGGGQALADRVSELEAKLEELVLGGVIEADALPAVPDNYIYNVKNTTTIGALFKDILAYGSTSSGNEYIRNLSKYYISGNADVWQDNDEQGHRISGTLIFDVPITVPEMEAEGYTFPAGNVSKINIRDGEWNSGGYNGCAFVYTDGSVVGSTDEFGINATFSKRTDQIIINVPKVYSKGTQLVTMQDFNIFKNTIS